MTTPKAPYRTDGAWSIPKRSFSDKLRSELAQVFSEGVGINATPEAANEFVAQVQIAAQYAIGALHWDGYEISGQEIRAEIADLSAALRGAQSKLRALSPAVERLLGVEADPLGCADAIEAVLSAVREAEVQASGPLRTPKPVDRLHAISVELAARVLPVLEEFEIKPSATANPDLDSFSDAVRILKAIGNDIGLEFSPKVWRRKIAKAKKSPGEI